ncbi:hypothetical protein N2152v2_008065 [Parachlorella kessleri]
MNLRRKGGRRFASYLRLVLLGLVGFSVVTVILYKAVPQGRQLEQQGLEADAEGSEDEVRRLMEEPSTEYCVRQLQFHHSSEVGHDTKLEYSGSGWLKSGYSTTINSSAGGSSSSSGSSNGNGHSKGGKRAAYPLVCAHGGDAAAAPPNTAAAFQAAIDAGVRCVEVDVARTRDGVLVVLHSRDLLSLLRLATGSALLAAWQTAAGKQALREELLPEAGEFTWEQLQRLRWEGGAHIETVADVLSLVLPHTDHVTLDLKPYSREGDVLAQQEGEEHDVDIMAQQCMESFIPYGYLSVWLALQGGEEQDADVLAQQVVDLVSGQAGCRGGRCLVWAKSDSLVAAVKELAPWLPVGYVVLNETAEARAAGMARLLRLPQAEVVALHHALASPATTAQARAAGKQVHAWTANTAEMMARVLEAGVDAVVTNHPRRLLAALASRAQVAPATLLSDHFQSHAAAAVAAAAVAAVLEAVVACLRRVG